ncbi:hypothetical protein [uncultured Cetobacterium sp.]|uniref:hypothetical protein n=1 Tax=uncultured Cetobacterium sp. TaxID=527638 RepID=UPI00260599BF|nr:hypothetical protein [uncultured Cetobacterium sp.]
MNKVVISRKYLLLKNIDLNICEEFENASIDEDGFIVDINRTPLIYDTIEKYIQPFNGFSLKKDSDNKMTQILINVNENGFLAELKERYSDEIEKKIIEIEEQIGLLGVIVGSESNDGLLEEGAKNIKVIKLEEKAKVISFERKNKFYYGIQIELREENDGNILLTYVFENRENSKILFESKENNLDEVLEMLEILEDINSKAYEN